MHPADVALFKGPIVSTALYFCLWYYLLLGRQRGMKYKLKAEYAARGEVFDRYFGQDGRMLAVDRAVINTQEQMVPFLVAMWIHAVVVSPEHAAWLGVVYTALRAVYPALLGSSLSKMQSLRVVLATGPAYGIVFYLLASAVYVVLSSG
jgi:hypothetical protein